MTKISWRLQAGLHLRDVRLHDGLRAEPEGAREGGPPEGEAGALLPNLQQVQVLQEVQPHPAHQVQDWITDLITSQKQT